MSDGKLAAVIVEYMTREINYGGFTFERFAADMLWDGLAIRESQDPFFWILRDSGTHIARSRASLKMVWNTFADCRKVFRWDGTAWYLYRTRGARNVS